MRVISILLILMCLSFNALGQQRDPFESILPKEDLGIKTEEGKAKIQVPPPDLTVQGILWGSDKPQAIINGDVYGVGEVIKEMPQTKIHKIEKGSVIIIHQGIVFQYGTKSNKK